MEKIDKMRIMVTEIITCYNAQMIILQAVISALEQTCKDLEIVMADDAYTDNSCSVLKELENKLYWSMDITYSQDASRIRKENRVRNISLLKKPAMNILRKKTEVKKLFAKKKRFSALLYSACLEKLLKIGIF